MFRTKLETAFGQAQKAQYLCKFFTGFNGCY